MDSLDHNSSFITAEHHLVILASVSFHFPHMTLMAIAKLERLQVFRALYLTRIYTTVPAVSLLIFCVETLGKINPILCPHFVPLLHVTVHLCSLERQRNQHGKPGIPSLKSMIFFFFFHSLNNPYVTGSGNRYIHQ